MPDEKQSFGEKIRNHTPDILFVGLMIIVFSVFANAKRQGLVPNNNIEQTVDSLQKATQYKSVFFNDTIKQYTK